MTIDKSRITIATVTENEFNDYVRVIGQVLPSRMIYLDAIEGGRVEERLHEEGAMVKKGDVILRLSNPLLNIGIMQSEADLAYQENELRNTRISMEQERLSLKQDRIGIQKEFIIKKRRYGQYKRLMDPLIQYRQLFFYRFIFLRSLEIVLPRYQLPLHQPHDLPRCYRRRKSGGTPS